MRYAIGIAAPLLVAVLMLAATPAVAERSVTVGILAFEPEDVARERWGPLIEHLDAELDDVTVDAVIAEYSALDQELRNNRLDFLLTNPTHFIRIRSDSHLSGALATLVPMHHGTPLRGFGGVAFTRAGDDHINDWEDIAGQRIAAVVPESLGGYQAQVRELRERGATPRDADVEFTGMPHDRVVERVLDGEADVGFVRIGILERLQDAGRIDPEEIRVIARQDMADFPLALSTRLYPEWPFIAIGHVPRELSHRMLVALLELDRQSAPAQAAGIDGFAVPMDYEPVEELARELRLPPFDAIPQLSLREFMQVYGQQVTLTLVVGSLMLALILGLVLVNRRLTTVRRELEDKAAALERSETHARALMRALPDSLFRMDRDGTFIECEAVSEEMLLMPPEEFLGRRLDELFPPAYAEPGTRAIREALNSGEVRDFEYDTTALGMPGHFEARVVPLNDREVLMIVRDVSQRFAMEAARSEERRFRENLLASLGEGVFGIDREGRFTFINPTGCRLLGFADQTEALGRDSHTTTHHSHPDGSHYPAQECPIHGVLVSGETVEAWEDHFWRQDGESFPVLVYASPMRDDTGELTGVVVSFQDISVRKAMERALADSEARFRLAQEAARFGIWEWDLAEDRIHWDAQCWRMLGEDPAEGQPLAYEDWRQRLHPEDLPEAEAQVQRQLTEGGKFSIEFRYRLADGGWLWTLGRGRVIEWGGAGRTAADDGHPRGYPAAQGGRGRAAPARERAGRGPAHRPHGQLDIRFPLRRDPVVGGGLPHLRTGPRPMGRDRGGLHGTGPPGRPRHGPRGHRCLGERPGCALSSGTPDPAPGRRDPHGLPAGRGGIRRRGHASVDAGDGARHHRTQGHGRSPGPAPGRRSRDLRHRHASGDPTRRGPGDRGIAGGAGGTAGGQPVLGLSVSRGPRDPRQHP